jgi:hypothetical protein
MKDTDGVSKHDIRNNVNMITFRKKHPKQAHTFILEWWLMEYK